MDTMLLTKIVGTFCAAMLVLLCGNWAASAIYAVGDGAHHGGHGDDHGEHKQGYYIEVAKADSDAAEEEPVEIDVAALMASADVTSGEKVFKKCASCHKLDPGANGAGPSLHGIVDNDIAAVDGFGGYSDALLGLEGNWTAEALVGFLGKPKDYAPGTKMNFAGLKKPQDRADLIAYLSTTE